MKLLLCGYCDDVFNLRFHYKECSCGNTAGAYISKEKAVYSGDFVVCLAIHNKWVKFGIANRYESIHFGDRTFIGWSVPENTANFMKVDNVREYLSEDLIRQQKHLISERMSNI